MRKTFGAKNASCVSFEMFFMFAPLGLYLVWMCVSSIDFNSAIRVGFVLMRECV